MLKQYSLYKPLFKLELLTLLFRFSLAFFCWTFLFSQVLGQGVKENELTNQVLEQSINKETSLTWTNRSELLAYYRNSFVIETTGNEATLGVALGLDFELNRRYKGKDFRFVGDLYILEQLSLRGRFYENFNPPVIYPNRILADLPLFKFGRLESRLELGIVRPATAVMPMKSYYLPTLFSVSERKNTETNTVNPTATTYLNHSMATGHRDYPIAYLIAPHYDTGVHWWLRFAAFEMLLGISNGEMGLDSNSAKTISGRFAYRDDLFFGGLVFQVGNIASVPIKENQHLTKLFFYFDHQIGTAGKITWGLETMLLFHGLRDLDVLNRAVKGEFQYADGFFTPFTVYNDGSYDASAQFSQHMLYGLTGQVFFKLEWADFALLTHFSIYDPNLLSENKAIYQRRYRGFLRLAYDFTPFLKTVFSYTYTYDRYFNQNSQFYDATETRSIHPIIDHDFYAGVVFALY